MDSLINHNAEEIYNDFLEQAENAIQEQLYPGDERRIFAEALIMIIIQFLATADDSTKQKFLQNARGDVLDANGEAYGVERLEGEKATTEITFSLQSIVSMDILIPKGTLVTNDSEHFFETLTDAVIPNGELAVTVPAEATAAGSEYNNIGIGEIDVLVSSIAYIDNVTNTIATSGGTDNEDDDTYRERIRLSQDRYASGTENYYKYHAVTADTNIQDIYITNDEEIVSLGEISDDTYYFSTENIPSNFFINSKTQVEVYYSSSESSTSLKTINCDVIGDNVAVFNKSSTEFDNPILYIPKRIPGTVLMYIVDKNGVIPTEAELLQITNACNDSSVRSFNDRVIVKAADIYNYDISVNVYIDPSEEVEAIKEAITQAVEDYKTWQCAKIGRQVNKDKLQMFIMQAGAYKVTVNSPGSPNSPKTSIPICTDTIVNFVVAEEQ